MLEVVLGIFIILTIGLSIVVYRAINRLGFYEDMYGDMYGRFNELGENIRSVVNNEIYTDDPVIKSFVNQLQEIEAILEYLNIEYRRLRSKTFKKFLENYNKKLSSRDADKYVDGDADVVDLAKIINEFALIRNEYLGITKGLDQKQWQLTNIVKLRVAGMEDANIK